jgi:hypothetical protein
MRLRKNVRRLKSAMAFLPDNAIAIRNPSRLCGDSMLVDATDKRRQVDTDLRADKI